MLRATGWGGDIFRDFGGEDIFIDFGGGGELQSLSSGSGNVISAQGGTTAGLGGFVGGEQWPSSSSLEP